MPCSASARERNWTKRKLAAELGLSDESLLSHYERGKKLTRENLDSLVTPLEHPPEAVDALLFVHRLITPDLALEPASPVALTAAERTWVHRAVLTAGWTVADELLTLLPATNARKRNRQGGVKLSATVANRHGTETGAVQEGEHLPGRGGDFKLGHYQEGSRLDGPGRRGLHSLALGRASVCASFPIQP